MRVGVLLELEAARSVARPEGSRSSMLFSTSTGWTVSFRASISPCLLQWLLERTSSTASWTTMICGILRSGPTTTMRFEERFLAAPFPEDIRKDLASFLDAIHYPLAVRSSSLLEDSQYQPFAGIYETYMLPNHHQDVEVRLEQLIDAIKRVYASTFSVHAKAYLRATPYRLEEEKMAVILQKLVGSVHGERFYPDFAGVARSYNFYPTAPMTSEDGIAAVALGLGKTVCDGGTCIRFCPKYPRHLVQFSSVKDVLQNSQRHFFALELNDGDLNLDGHGGVELVELGLEAAEADGTLAAVGATYSPENDAVYDGLSRPACG